MNKQLTIACVTALAIIGLVLLLHSNLGSNAVWRISENGTLLLPLVIVSALLDSINPCAFSILLVTIAILLGLGTVRGKLLAVGSMYITGIFVAYLTIGLGILGTFHIFSVPHFMGKLGALFLIVWGLTNLANELLPSFPIRPQIPHAAHRKMATLVGQASLPAAFVLGVLVGLCEFPCTGGPYLLVLGLLHDSSTYLRGFGYLLLYNTVFVLPLFVVLVIVGNRSVLERFEAWKRVNIRSMRFWTGVLMVIFGVFILIF